MAKKPRKERPKITPRSAKNKGKRFEKVIKEYIKKYIELGDDDIRTTIGSEGGTDIKRMSDRARLQWPFAVECKNRQRLNIWEAIEQASVNADKEGGGYPIVVFGRNNQKPWVALDFKLFLGMVKKVYKDE